MPGYNTENTPKESNNGGNLFYYIKQGIDPGIEITDFQMPDKISDTIKHLPDILKIYRTSCIIQCKKFN